MTGRAGDADVIIVGSGFGGAIAAHVLSLNGVRVLLLERGPWRDTVPVRSMGIADRAPLPLGWRVLTHALRSLQLGRLRLLLNRRGLFEFQSHKGLHVAVASSVGGASIAWGALLEPPIDPYYWRDRHPKLRVGAVEWYYCKVKDDFEAIEFNRGTVVPLSVWDILADSSNGECKPAAKQPMLAMKFAASRPEAGASTLNGDQVERRTCTFDGDGFLGSAGGAKASTDFTYLARALRQGARIKALCEVKRIIPSRSADGPGYDVHYTDMRSGKKACCSARLVVLAAGTLNTVKLLARSSSASAGLAEMPALGCGFGANGDMLGLWTRGDEAPGSLDAPPFLGNIQTPEQGDATIGLISLAWLKDLPLLRRIHRILRRRFLIVGMGSDGGTGSIRFSRESTMIAYDARREPIYARIRAAASRLGHGSASKVWMIGKPLTVHPWGGARIGPDPRLGVVDHRGEVYGNPGLYVADGSALPAAPGGPPALTIAAWAYHVAGRIAESLKVPEDNDR